MVLSPSREQGGASSASWMRPRTPKFFSPICKSLMVANLHSNAPPGGTRVRARPARNEGTPLALATTSYVVPGARPSNTTAPGPAGHLLSSRRRPAQY